MLAWHLLGTGQHALHMGTPRKWRFLPAPFSVQHIPLCLTKAPSTALSSHPIESL